ncbi:Regulation of nuclear pre-mRNA domain-containing protein 1A [Lucilia cuprina]|nr:Regulation of nuclear pre-mRNA domain-containing protein 1A [Lucilia cuprina]
MSAFTEVAFLKKLAELNSSQQSIQTLSLWLIHHRKHHASIVKTWLRELQNVPEAKKLTFMYLANDVIQNSKKKGPESSLWQGICKCFAKGILSHRRNLLGRILNIWEERGVYEPKTIAEYRNRLNKEHGKLTAVTATTSATKEASEEKRESKRKHEEHKSKSKKSRVSPTEETNSASVVAELNGGDGDQSPYLPLGEPPEPEELIKALISIENSASSDAVVRERIANLPPEISEISCLAKLEDKDAAKNLATQVNEAVELLNDYNSRLSAEMEERTKLTSMLRDFQAEQKELLAQAEKRLEEYKKKLQKVLAVQKEIRDHLSNLPDLTQLPDVTGGLAPLPSAGDLFNIH